MNNKKLTITILGILIILTVFSSGCVNNSSETLTLNEEGKLSQKECSDKNLEDKIIMIESQNCPHCRLALPKLQELEQELNVSIKYIDVSTSEGREKLDEYNIIPRYTPTVLIGCNILIGDKSKEEFKEAIEAWKNAEEK